MDLLLILKDGSSASLAGNLFWSMEARRAGREVSLLVTSEALVTLVSGSFLWPRELASQEWRLAVADAAKSQGLPIVLRGEARQLDVHALFALAKEARVAMYADPIWTDLLGLRGKLPAGITELDALSGLELMENAKKIIGSL